MRRGVILLFAIAVLTTAGCRRAVTRATTIPPQEPPRSTSAPRASEWVQGVTLVTNRGGRVAWYQGSAAAHELVAFDAVTDASSRNTDVFVMQPDGSGRQCISCRSSIPDGFIGQPAWHPDGEHILVQAENSHSGHGLFNHVSWGIDNDLWLIARDGSVATRVWSTKPSHAALHPHFNKDGTVLIFAERVPTGRSRRSLAGITPGGENPWDGWRIHIADFDVSRSTLTNHRTLQPNGRGFYETHGFAADGRIVYSHTAGGRAYVDDIYAARPDGSAMTQLVNSPSSWDEHGTFSPSGSGAFAFNSSRAFADWNARTSKLRTLRTELFLELPSGDITQVTRMNELLHKRVLVSDFDWSRDGRRILVQAAPVDEATGSAESPQLWMVTFRHPM